MNTTENTYNALNVFHAATADLAQRGQMDWRKAQGLVFDRMVSERPDIARKVLNALLAEMSEA